MRAIVLFTSFATFTAQVVLAAPASGFSCERIKERAVREACIKDRADKVAGENAEMARVAAEKEKAAEREKQENDLITHKKKETAAFVAKSTRILAERLKDPDSAKFTKLRVANNNGQQLVCGSVNAKNSYGGYVGAKDFYVLWADDSGAAPEVYVDGDIAAKAQAKMDELMKTSQNSYAGLSARISAAEEGDRVVAKAKSDIVRASQILSERCNKSATPVED
jgi:hypothetical protein